jgi:hypothetical protein
MLGFTSAQLPIQDGYYKNSSIFASSSLIRKHAFHAQPLGA